MDKEIKNKINALAKLLYKSNGYQVDDDYDFSTKRHPEERGMWNMALISYCFLNGKMDLLKYQV